VREEDAAANSPRRLLAAGRAAALHSGRRAGLIPQQNQPPGGWETRDATNPCFGRAKPANFTAATATAAGSAGSADAVDSRNEVSGHGGRKLLAAQQETEPPAVRCPFYTELLQASEVVPACTVDAGQLQGVWFGATVKNGWARQVRLQAKVSGAAADPSIYIAGIVMSMTKV
jgi:hypothetical protein